MISKEQRINGEIRAREVRLIGVDGEQLGVFSAREALRIAEEHGLDLVEVAPHARPPVCRIMDFGKYKYEQAKRDREARKNQKTIEVKEVKMRPNIDDHDFEVKARNAERFLKAGNKVKCTIMFRGREIIHSAKGKEVLERLKEFVSDFGVVEQHPKVEGRNMTMLLAPKVARDGKE